MNFFTQFFSTHRTPLHIHTAALTGLNYNYITDGIYVGTNQCCTMGLTEVLVKEKITCDISLEEKHLDQPFGVDVYVWIPIPDHLIPTNDQLEFGISALEKLVSQGKKYTFIVRMVMVDQARSCLHT